MSGEQRDPINVDSIQSKEEGEATGAPAPADAGSGAAGILVVVDSDIDDDAEDRDVADPVDTTSSKKERSKKKRKSKLSYKHKVRISLSGKDFKDAAQKIEKNPDIPEEVYVYKGTDEGMKERVGKFNRDELTQAIVQVVSAMNKQNNVKCGETGDTGRGVFNKGEKNIPPGTVVGVAFGTVTFPGFKGNYVIRADKADYCIDGEPSLAYGVTDDFNLSLFNHSCSNMNCIYVSFPIPDTNMHVIVVRTTKPVKKGQELTVNYGKTYMVNQDAIDELVKAKEAKPSDFFPCLCGNPCPHGRFMRNHPAVTEVP